MRKGAPCPGRYDFRRSTAACAVVRGRGGECAPVPSLCPAPATLAAVSPRWLGVSIALAGPLLGWAPLAAAMVAAPRQAPLRSLAPLLAAAALTFLALVMPVRYLHHVLAYDPSGHIFIVGVELAPLCAFMTGARSRARAW